MIHVYVHTHICICICVCMYVCIQAHEHICVEAEGLLDASSHDDCTCMYRKYSVSLKDDLNSTRHKCIRLDFKLHHIASGLAMNILYAGRKNNFNASLVANTTTVRGTCPDCRQPHNSAQEDVNTYICFVLFDVVSCLIS